MKHWVLFLCNFFPFIAMSQGCQDYREYHFEAKSIEPTLFLQGTDSIYFNEARYYCTNSALYLRKALFDRFGKWDIMLESESPSKTLIWHSIQLFPEIDRLFYVAASGIESRDLTFNSILVFDQEGNDLLQEGSLYREMLLDYFGSMIENLYGTSHKKGFYETYWPAADPERWKKIKRAGY